MRIEEDLKLGFSDVLFRPKRSTLNSRSQVELKREFLFKHSGRSWTGVPIIAANMDTVATFAMTRALAKHDILTAVHKHYSVDEWQAFVEGETPEVLQHVIVSSGISEQDFEKLQQVLALSDLLTFICIDVANGYSEHFTSFVRRARQQFPKHTIIAGNVVTGEMVEELILSGADIIKVGIGPGSVCTTRVKTGGCTCPGDVAKAFGGGADFVMLGGMLAAHEECGGELVERDGNTYMNFYGMSSSSAMDKHAGGVAKYRAAEGKTVQLAYRGPVEDTVQDILGGVRSTCTYVGAARLKELTKRTTFIRVREQENNVYGKE